jgi:hypothetical protein
MSALRPGDLAEFKDLFREVVEQMRDCGATDAEIAQAMFAAGPQFALRDLAAEPPGKWPRP